MLENLGSIALFVRLADTRSFSVAARQLGMSVPGASKSFARLEARLGVRLLNRTTRKVSLTDVWPLQVPESSSFRPSLLRRRSMRGNCASCSMTSPPKGHRCRRFTCPAGNCRRGYVRSSSWWLRWYRRTVPDAWRDSRPMVPMVPMVDGLWSLVCGAGRPDLQGSTFDLVAVAAEAGRSGVLRQRRQPVRPSAAAAADTSRSCSMGLQPHPPASPRQRSARLQPHPRAPGRSPSRRS